MWFALTLTAIGSYRSIYLDPGYDKSPNVDFEGFIHWATAFVASLVGLPSKYFHRINYYQDFLEFGFPNNINLYFQYYEMQVIK